MRTISDEYELPDDDDDFTGLIKRRRPHNIAGWIVIAVLALICIGAAYAALRVTSEEKTDSFCIGCHTAPEIAYYDRSTSAIAGALAVDLSSFHYQQIRGQDGTLHCIDCHQGNGSLGSHVDTLALSVKNAVTWLSGREDRTVEKLRVGEPALANDSCLACHQKTLLLAGMANHYHNMLPAAYGMWRNGGSLIPPPGAADRQAVIAGGLVRYNTTVLCSDCHQAHRSTETDLYLDKQVVVPLKCVLCHREVGQGPMQVTVP